MQVDKQSWRRYLLEKRDRMPLQEVKKKSEIICMRLQRHIDDFFCIWKEKNQGKLLPIFGYFPKGNEVDIRELLNHLLVQNDRYQVLLPRVKSDKKTMAFRAISTMEDLEKGSFGLKEPSDSCKEMKADAGIVLLPCVGCDALGRRIGYGAGFYDRYFSESINKRYLDAKNKKRSSERFIAPIYAFQQIPQIISERQDIGADVLVTEMGDIEPPADVRGFA